MYLEKFTSVQKVLEHLWMATSGDSDDKILLFNNTPESNRMLFWKNTLTKNISYKENKEKIKNKLSSKKQNVLQKTIITKF